jgi:hypothetical protein
MALRQVFVSTNADLEATGGDNGDMFTDISTAGNMGIWDHAGDSGKGAWRTSALFTGGNGLPAISATNFPADGAAAVSDETDLEAVADQMRLDRALGADNVLATALIPSFQLVQGYGSTGNPIASPIIRSHDLVDVDYIPYNAPVKEVVDLDTSGITAPVVGDIFTLKVQVRFSGEPSLYDAQINPAAQNIGATLSHIIDQSQKVFSVEFVAATTTLADSINGIRDAVNAHGVLKNIITASNNSNDVRLTSKIDGMHVVAQFLEGGVKLKTSTVSTIGERGNGSYAQVLSDEKKSRLANLGSMNRLYLPENFTTFAASGTDYDTIIFRYKNRLHDHLFGGGQPTINEAVVYIKDLGTGGTNDWEEAIPFTPGSARKFRFAAGGSLYS